MAPGQQETLNTDERKMCGFAASVYAMLSPTIVL
jgi:hypothetical protein